MRKLPARMHAIVMPFFLTMIMTAIVSGISTVHALGIHGIFHIWFESWLFSWAIAFPTMVGMLPLVGKWTRTIVED